MSDDERVRSAARSLPSERFAVSLHDGTGAALRAIAREGAEVVVVELQLGQSGGFAFARDLAGDPATSAVRVVMLCDRPHDRWLSRQAGAHAVVVKPLPDTSTLAEAIEEALAGGPVAPAR